MFHECLGYFKDIIQLLGEEYIYNCLDRVMENIIINEEEYRDLNREEYSA